MGLVQRAINGLYKGITKQAPTNRIDGQVEDSVNMLHTVEKGISRRNPTQFVANLGLTLEDAYVHSYARGDDLEEYIVVIQDKNIKVYDTNGVEYVVNTTTDTLNYLDLPNGAKAFSSFKTTTIGDTTFISNKNIICSMINETIIPSEPHLANPFYWVKRSFDNGQNTGYDYTLDGVTVNSVKTTEACDYLVNGINNSGNGSPDVIGLGSDYINYGSLVVKKTRPTEFTWSDSYGSQASQGFWGTAEKIEDLPNTLSGADKDYNFILEITGDSNNAFTNFWVKYENDTWKETVAPDLINNIDNKTMPIKLVRNAIGEFDLSLINYAPRKVGDENTASLPSFIDNTITDMFFFKNRFCFASKENIIMSEIGSFEDINFFPTTVTDVLASDPIDVSVDSNVVSFINHAIPFNNNVVLMSTSGQFSLQSDKVLSPEDVSITSTTSYDALSNVSPISLGNSLFFLSSTLQGTSLREYLVDDTGTSNIAVDVSGHVKGLIPNNIKYLKGNTNEDIIFIFSEDTPDTIYIYKYYNEGQERIQTSFSKWVFGGTIYNITVLNDYIYLLIDRGEGIQLEKVDYTSSTKDVISYLDNGNIQYARYMILSEPMLKDNNGKLIQSARSPLMFKTLQLASSSSSDYEIKIEHPLRNRVAHGYATKDNKVLVQGKTKEVKVTVQSMADKPLEFHTYTTELNYNIRAKIV